MDYVGPHRAAVLLQQGLIEAEEIGDRSKIFDCETVTVLNPKNLTDSRYVAYAYFDPDTREVFFYSAYPNFEDDDLRGRASVQVLEF
jgi:hypothetical protein